MHITKFINKGGREAVGSLTVIQQEPYYFVSGDDGFCYDDDLWIRFGEDIEGFYLVATLDMVHFCAGTLCHDEEFTLFLATNIQS